MEKSKILLDEMKKEQLESINGGNYGASILWGEFLSAVNPWGSCSWPGGFYSKPTSGSGSTCTSH